MSCPITLTGSTGSCPGMGGIKRIWIADRSVLETAPTIILDVITDLQELEETFVEYKVKPKTLGLTSTLQKNSANNALHYESTVNVSLFGLSGDHNAEFMALAMGDLAVVVEDLNGVRWFLGLNNPVEMTEGESGTGTDSLDKSGYSFTLTDFSVELPKEVNKTINLVAVAP